MEPVGFAFGVLSSVSLALKGLNSLSKFYHPQEHATGLQLEMLQMTEALRAELMEMQNVIEGQRMAGDLSSLVKLDDMYKSQIMSCSYELEQLHLRLSNQPPWYKRPGRIFRGKNETEQIAQALRRCKNMIDFASLRREKQARLDEQARRGKDVQDSLDTEREAQKRRDTESTIRWISCGVHYQQMHQKVCALRQSGTKEGIFEDESFKTWSESKKGLLWINGPAGRGKTVVISTIVTHFLARPDYQDYEVAYFYCDFRDSVTTLSTSVLRTLIAQLLTPSNVQGLHLLQRIQRPPGSITDSSPPITILELTEILVAILKTARSPILVIDALDECWDATDLLVNLLLVCDQTEVRILIASRESQDFQNILRDVPAIPLGQRISMVNEDIRRYIVASLRDTAMADSLRSRLIETLVGQANGMFRWVQCQLDIILECATPEDIENALKTLPKTLDDTYEKILAAIDNDGYDRQEVARTIFLVVIGGPKPVRISALCEVLAIIPTNIEWLADNRTLGTHNIPDICHQLLSIGHDQDGQDVVTCTHFSVKDYITSKRCPEKYRVYPSDAAILWGPQLSAITKEDSCTEPSIFGPLYRFYFHHWVQFVEQYPSAGLDHVVARLRRLFIDNNASIELQRHAFTQRYRFQRKYDYPPPDEDFGDLVGLCILFHMPKLLDHVLAKDSYLANTTIGSALGTPLNLAAHTEHLDVIPVLLKHGADINTTHSVKLQVSSSWSEANPLDDGIWNPLLIAVHNGSDELVELLLSRDADANVIGTPESYTPLHHCSIAFHGDRIARLLLEKGADIHAKDSQGRTPLHCAASWRWGADLAEVLLNHDADLEAEMKDGTTPVQLSKNKDVTQFLWKNGAKGTPRDERAIPEKSEFDPRVRK